MWPDRISNPGPLTYKSGALPTALPGPTVKSLIYKLYSQLLIRSFYSQIPDRQFIQSNLRNLCSQIPDQEFIQIPDREFIQSNP